MWHCSSCESSVSSGCDRPVPAKGWRNRHPPKFRNKTLHQCLRLGKLVRFADLLRKGASMMKLNKKRESVIESLFELRSGMRGPIGDKSYLESCMRNLNENDHVYDYNTALSIVIHESTWFTSANINSNRLLELACKYDELDFCNFLIKKGADVYILLKSPDYIYMLRNKNKCVVLIQYIINKNACDEAKRLHDNDKNSWLYKDYLCNDIFKSIISYVNCG